LRLKLQKAEQLANVKKKRTEIRVQARIDKELKLAELKFEKQQKVLEREKKWKKLAGKVTVAIKTGITKRKATIILKAPVKKRKISK
jgi:hypothetical protein